ncbi:MAG: glycosyltransferase family 4 protein [Spirochaetes bacterium]|nr:glycosyltransferase family 4 protein [Spirochaetota bacterium]
MKDVKVFSFAKDYKKYYIDYKAEYPGYAKYFKKHVKDNVYSARLCYTIFINNIYQYLPLLERDKIPFVFTLYPGGGFWLNEKVSDDKLQKVFASPLFRAVITTQYTTYNYLRKNGFCPEDRIVHKFGGVLPSDYFNKHNGISKQYFKNDKDTFDICFVANKYMNGGIDKGYDIFIEVARRLLQHRKDIRFHIVGGFDRSDVEMKDIDGYIHFYGIQYKAFFTAFYKKMDIILSPNRPFILYPGSFDGFPTGSCVEAGLNGVAVFCSDVLNENKCFNDGKELKIIATDPESIAASILPFIEKPNDLYILAQKGFEKFHDIYDIEKQMAPRVETICANLK